MHHWLVRDLFIQPCVKIFHSDSFNSALAEERLLAWVTGLYGWHCSDIPKPAICLLDRFLSSLVIMDSFENAALFWAEETGAICRQHCKDELLPRLFFTFLLEFVTFRALKTPLRNLWFSSLHPFPVILLYVVQPHLLWTLIHMCHL